MGFSAKGVIKKAVSLAACLSVLFGNISVAEAKTQYRYKARNIAAPAQEDGVCGSVADVIAEARTHMTRRESEFRIPFSISGITPDGLVEDIKTHLFDETGNPREGKALYWNVRSKGGIMIEGKTVHADGVSDLTEGDVVITGLSYSTTAEQEEELEKKLEETSDEVTWSEDEYDRALEIAEWVHNHVKYDNDLENKIDTTAYSALCQGRASCLGYSFLYERLALIAGLDASVVHNRDHAWNQVRLESGEVLNIDCTGSVQLVTGERMKEDIYKLENGSAGGAGAAPFFLCLPADLPAAQS